MGFDGARDGARVEARGGSRAAGPGAGSALHEAEGDVEPEVLDAVPHEFLPLVVRGLCVAAAGYRQAQGWRGEGEIMR